MSDIATSTQADFSANEEKVISAYKNTPKIKSPSARRAFLDNFIPQMESQLGLVDFVTDDIREIIKENPAQATNIVEMIKHAQRRMHAEAAQNHAFLPPEEPLLVGREEAHPADATPDVRSRSSYRVVKAVDAIKARVGDLSKLTGPALDVLRAILSDNFSDEEIEDVFLRLGVR